LEIATGRLLLREFAPTDLAALAAYHADPRYRRFYAPADLRPGHEARLLSMFQRWARESPRTNYQLAIVRGGDLIGWGGVRMRGLPPGCGELGLEIAPGRWGRGYASEASRALLDFAFSDLRLDEIRGTSAAGNTRVERLVRRLGLRRVATCGNRVAWRLPRAAYNGGK
jgi:ribosomal-protein-alanine N-acetyltransferase